MAPENKARWVMYVYHYNQTGVPCLLQWKNNKNYLHGVCVCNLWYPACNVRHSFICGLSGSQYFSTSHKVQDF